MKIDNQQKITPFLWFDQEAEEAAKYYVSIFENSSLVNVSPGPDGKALAVTFSLDGLTIHALNGGPQFRFTPAISLFVSCEDQAEVDYLWEALGKDGRYDRCGWLQDKYGLSWQIIPNRLGELLHSDEKEKAGKAMQAMLQMNKIEIDKLEAAYES